ncbi:hypothetical protein Tco_0834804 [Tanacetum coccineum]
MIENQRSQKDKQGLGFTEDRASTSEVKTRKLGLDSVEMATEEPVEPVFSAREPASSDVGNRPSTELPSCPFFRICCHYIVLMLNCWFIQTYMTHIIVGMGVGGQDVICVKQKSSSTISTTDLRGYLEDLGDCMFSDGASPSL